MSFRVGLVVLAAFLARVLVLFQIAARPPEAPPHHVFVNGIVLTMDDRAPMVEAVSVRHDRIESVGNSEEILANILLVCKAFGMCQHKRRANAIQSNVNFYSA